MLLQQHVKNPGHSAKSADGWLQLNMYALYVCGFVLSEVIWCMVVWRAGSSFKWHQPCNDQTALQLRHLGGYSKHDVESYRHPFRVTCDKSALSLLESRE